jgi:hypothetical protein
MDRRNESPRRYVCCGNSRLLRLSIVQGTVLENATTVLGRRP